jgi:hypothetical protein
MVKTTQRKKAAAKSASKTAMKPVARTAARPAKKAKQKPSFLDRVASWPIPTDAAGLARPWNGMAVDDRAHALLGCGYPRMLVAIDEPIAELKDFATYKKLYGEKTVIPRALAPIRQAVEETKIFSIEEYEKSMRSGKGAPLAEAVEGLFKYGRQTLRTLEIIHGSTAVAEAAVKQLASYPMIVWHGYDELDEKEARKIGQTGLESRGYMTIRQLGHLLWRVPVAVEKKLRAELVKVLDKARDPEGKLWRAAQALDVILNGRAAVERFGSNFNGALHLSDLVHAHDDPDWVASMVTTKLKTLRPADREHFDIQLAVVGGPKVLAALRKGTAAFKKDQAKSIAEQLSLCA